MRGARWEVTIRGANILNISVKGGQLFKAGDYFKYFCQRGAIIRGKAIILNIFIKGERLFKGGDCFKYLYQRGAII